MERKLASVQKVEDVSPVENSDNLDVISVLGWKVVSVRGEFKPGDLCVYCEIDSVLPEREEFEFLRPRKFRIKTLKLRGQISQGIAFPTTILDEKYDVGTDVTEILEITKYDPPLPGELEGVAIGRRPYFVPKTSEPRIQSSPRMIKEFQDKEVYISTKIDGTSCSIYYYTDHETPFGVCSRKTDLEKGGVYWDIANKYNLEEKIISNGFTDIVIQGELAGPKINKNRLNLKEPELFVFTIFFFREYRYAGLEEMRTICNLLGLKTVPIDEVTIFNFDIPSLLEKSKGFYPGTKNRREGIVIRPVTPIGLHSRDLLSVKVVNNDYLLKDED